jgi:hypothetical protein
MKGIFALKTPRDLFAKLESDFERVKRDPVDSYAAFDFCVSAWHLVDWKFPDAQDPARFAFLQRFPILRICEHLAVGAKHFEPTRPSLKSITGTDDTSVWEHRAWKPGSWKPGAWAGELLIHLDGEAKKAFGDKITLPNLAEKVMSTWRAEL